VHKKNVNDKVYKRRQSSEKQVTYYFLIPF